MARDPSKAMLAAPPCQSVSRALRFLLLLPAAAIAQAFSVDDSTCRVSDGCMRSPSNFGYGMLPALGVTLTSSASMIIHRKGQRAVSLSSSLRWKWVVVMLLLGMVTPVV